MINEYPQRGERDEAREEGGASDTPVVDVLFPAPEEVDPVFEVGLEGCGLGFLEGCEGGVEGSEDEVAVEKGVVGEG